jgi:hypothetical protein
MQKITSSLEVLMKKAWIPITIVAFALSPAAIRADGGSSTTYNSSVSYADSRGDEEMHDSSDQASAVEEATATTPMDNSQGQGVQEDSNSMKYVSEPADDKVSGPRSKTWQNIALAAFAIVVAIVAIVLVNKNDGHRAHGHHHN